MARNLELDAMTGGPLVATDEIPADNTHVELIKLAVSADGDRSKIPADPNGGLRVDAAGRGRNVFQAVETVSNIAPVPSVSGSGYIPEMTNKPFGFSEITWPSTAFFGGEQSQADFIPDATGRLTTAQGMNLHIFAWPWLHDLGGPDDTGLIKTNGTEKQAYQVWKDL